MPEVQKTYDSSGSAVWAGIRDLRDSRKHPYDELLDSDRLDGKTVLVTGASSGLGLAISRNLAYRGARVLMVEDIVTTGLSSRECIAGINEEGGVTVGAACLIDRSGGKAEIGVPLAALTTLDIPAYPADKLPPELAAIPAIKPGSRGLK